MYVLFPFLSYKYIYGCLCVFLLFLCLMQIVHEACESGFDCGCLSKNVIGTNFQTILCVPYMINWLALLEINIISEPSDHLVLFLCDESQNNSKTCVMLQWAHAFAWFVVALCLISVTLSSTNACAQFPFDSVFPSSCVK